MVPTKPMPGFLLQDPFLAVAPPALGDVKVGKVLQQPLTIVLPLLCVLSLCPTCEAGRKQFGPTPSHPPATCSTEHGHFS